MLRLFFLILLGTFSVSAQLLDEDSENELDAIEHPLASPGDHIILADDSDEPDSGNWYEKLRWWKEAKLLYTVDVTGAMSDLESLSQEYDAKKNEIFSALEAYSTALPVNRQSAVQVIDELIGDLVKRQEDLAKEQARSQNRKTPEESTELEDHQKMLNQLKKYFEDFNTLYQRLTEAFESTFVEQIRNAQLYDQKALESFESIEHTLDDKKAQEKLGLVENSLENIQSIIAYLKGDLWYFVDQSWSKTQELMPAITKSIADLEEKGVVVRPLSSQEKQEMAALEKKRQELRAQKEAEKAAERERQLYPWWKKILYAIGSFFYQIGQGLTKPFIWLVDLFRTTPVQQGPPLSKKKAVAKTNVKTSETIPQKSEVSS